MKRKDNILIISKIRQLMKKKKIKASNKVISQLDKFVRDVVNYILDIAKYETLTAGKKIVSVTELKNAIQKLKEEKSLEI